MASIPVLYISYDGMTDPLGQSQVIPYLVALTKHGYSFTILSCEKADRFKTNEAEIRQLLAQHNIRWEPIPFTTSPPVISKIRDRRLLRKTAIRLQEQYHFAITHCRSYVAAEVGLMMKKKYGTKLLFDMRGLWADEKVDAGSWPQTNPLFRYLYRLYKKKEKAFMENADHIVSLTSNAKHEIHTWKHIVNNPVPITVIPCCVDLDLFNPEALDTTTLENYRQQLGLHADDFVVSYLGSFGSWYMMEEMLDLFKVLLQKVPQAKFLFITPQAKADILGAVAAKGIPADHVYITEAKRKQVPYFLALSRYSVFFIRATYSKKSSSPTKQGEIMAMGIPLICNSGVGDTDWVVEEYHSGVVLRGFEEAQYQKGIEDLLQGNFNAADIRRGADSYFSLKQGAARYLSIYQSLSGISS
jgi:glycosyltransferase involved in cell wall biosynthesis